MLGVHAVVQGVIGLLFVGDVLADAFPIIFLSQDGQKRCLAHLAAASLVNSTLLTGKPRIATRPFEVLRSCEIELHVAVGFAACIANVTLRIPRQWSKTFIWNANSLSRVVPAMVPHGFREGIPSQILLARHARQAI